VVFWGGGFPHPGPGPATFSQWEKDLPTLFKAYLGQLWSQTAPTIF
jgi:hypothetical protein